MDFSRHNIYILRCTLSIRVFGLRCVPCIAWASPHASCSLLSVASLLSIDQRIARWFMSVLVVTNMNQRFAPCHFLQKNTTCTCGTCYLIKYDHDKIISFYSEVCWWCFQDVKSCHFYRQQMACLTYGGSGIIQELASMARRLTTSN